MQTVTLSEIVRAWLDRLGVSGDKVRGLKARALAGLVDGPKTASQLRWECGTGGSYPSEKKVTEALSELYRLSYVDINGGKFSLTNTTGAGPLVLGIEGTGARYVFHPTALGAMTATTFAKKLGKNKSTTWVILDE
jgi:hypothetical protein